MPSSQGEFTVRFETRTLWQQSKSTPSRSVSITTLSTVKLSTPVARTQKCPPLRKETSRMVTLWQFFRLTALSPTPGLDSRSEERRVGKECRCRVAAYD